ncbi:hypothetical protein EsH8_III_000403 [Colletotrichum jinshuiense]
MLFSAFALLAAAVVGLTPAAAQSASTTTEKSTVWLPPRSTRVGENIYASVITAAPSSTEFFLACTSVWQSASACSQFNGVTLTYGNNTMKIGFRSESFDCKRGDAATCSISAANAAGAQTVLASSESASWFTAITIVDGHDKLRSARSSTRSSTGGALQTSTSQAAAATSTASGAGICKRAKSGTGGTSGDADSASSGGSSSATKPKTGKDGDGCSAADGGFGGLPLVMAGVAAVVGAFMTMF